MAQRILVLLQDDIDNSEATQTVRFGVDGVEHEIDLNDHHAEQLRQAFATWAAAARKTSTTRPARSNNRPSTSTSTSTSTSRGSATPIDPEQSAAMRAWARSAGYTLSDRGRIPHTVQDAYHQAH